MSSSQPLAVADGSTYSALRHNVRAALRPEVWLVVAGLLAIDLVWGTWIGFSIGGWARIVGATAILLALAVSYQHRSRMLSDMALMASLWVALSGTGAVLTYLATTCALPLQDGLLMRYDQALGFDWLDWRDKVASQPVVHLVLSCAYGSLMPQIVLSCLLLPARRMTERCADLILMVAATLMLTMMVSAFFPVLGPWATFEGGDIRYLPHVQMLRAPGPWHFDFPDMEGIVTMPSYHTVLALLFIYAYRGMGAVGWVVAGLNALMLLSIPSIGGHYLVDMIVGSMIAGLCILAFRVAPRLRRSSRLWLET